MTAREHLQIKYQRVARWAWPVALMMVFPIFALPFAWLIDKVLIAALILLLAGLYQYLALTACASCHRQLGWTALAVGSGRHAGPAHCPHCERSLDVPAPGEP